MIGLRSDLLEELHPETERPLLLTRSFLTKIPQRYAGNSLFWPEKLKMLA